MDMMQKQAVLAQLHMELGFELPSAYQAILLAFEQLYVGELANGQDVGFDALAQLLQPFTPVYPNHQRLQAFMADSAHKYPAGQVYRRDTDALMATKTFTQSILMGSGDDGVYWFWNKNDGAVWDYYLDDGSVGWVAQDFATWMTGFQLQIRDEWNVFVDESDGSE